METIGYRSSSQSDNDEDSTSSVNESVSSARGDVHAQESGASSDSNGSSDASSGRSDDADGPVELAPSFSSSSSKDSMAPPLKSNYCKIMIEERRKALILCM